MIFRENVARYSLFLQKQPGEEQSPDTVPGQMRWALMADEAMLAPKNSFARLSLHELPVMAPLAHRRLVEKFCA